MIICHSAHNVTPFPTVQETSDYNDLQALMFQARKSLKLESQMHFHPLTAKNYFGKSSDLRLAAVG